MFSHNGLGLDEVLLVPSVSDVLPNEIDISAQVAKILNYQFRLLGRQNLQQYQEPSSLLKRVLWRYYQNTYQRPETWQPLSR